MFLVLVFSSCRDLPGSDLTGRSARAQALWSRHPEKPEAQGV